MSANPTLDDPTPISTSPAGLTDVEEAEFASLNGLPTTKHTTETTGRLHILHTRKFGAASKELEALMVAEFPGLQTGFNADLLMNQLYEAAAFLLPDNMASLSAQLRELIASCSNHVSNASSVVGASLRVKSEAESLLSVLKAKWALISPTSGPEWKLTAETTTILSPLVRFVDKVTYLHSEATRVLWDLKQRQAALEQIVTLETQR